MDDAMDNALILSNLRRDATANLFLVACVMTTDQDSIDEDEEQNIVEN